VEVWKGSPERRERKEGRPRVETDLRTQDWLSMDCFNEELEGEDSSRFSMRG